MRCQRAQQRLMAYHDGELSPGMARRVEKHLVSCPECSQLIEKLRRADDHVSRSDGVNRIVGVPDIPPPGDRYWDSFTARVLDRVEEDAATRVPDKSKPRRGWNFFIPRMAPAFSIALVVVVAAGVLMKMGGPVPVPEKPVAALEPRMEKAGSDLDETQAQGPSGKEDGGALTDAGDEELPVGPTGEMPSETRNAYRTAPEPEPARVADRTEKDLEPVRKKEALISPQAEGAMEKKDSLSTPEPPRPATPPPAETAVSPVAPRAAESEPEAREMQVVSPAEPEAVEQVRVEKTTETKPVVRIEGQRDDSPVAGKPSVPPEEDSGAVPAVSSALTAASGGAVDDFTVGKIVGAPAPAEQIAASEITAVSGQPEEPVGETGKEAAAPQTETRAMSESAPSETEGAFSSAVSEPRFSAVNALYRGPQDQLTHAKNLAEVRKFWESEQVLKDLLSKSPPSPIQEEASLLLVKVLSNQNRAIEAQRVLDSAKEQFPASEMIQTYQLESNGEKPVQ